MSSRPWGTTPPRARAIALRHYAVLAVLVLAIVIVGYAALSAR